MKIIKTKVRFPDSHGHPISAILTASRSPLLCVVYCGCIVWFIVGVLCVYVVYCGCMCGFCMV